MVWSSFNPLNGNGSVILAAAGFEAALESGFDLEDEQEKDDAMSKKKHPRVQFVCRIISSSSSNNCSHASSF
jgi:hypothetical protein